MFSMLQYGGWGWGWAWWWWVWWAVLLFLFVFLILTPTGRRWRGGQTAEEILKIRYARGELTREQYEAMLRDVRA